MAVRPGLRVGFIGLGNQGAPIAAHLAPAGFETRVLDLDPERVAALEETGARRAASARALAEESDVVCVCVPGDADVRAVLEGDSGVLAGAAAGTVVAIHSTLLPETVVALGEAAARRGIQLLDACVTGGAARATRKHLTYLVGGPAEALERVRPILECSAERILHAGPLGAGAKLKLCVNLITYIQWAAALESFRLAEAVGLPQEVLEEAGRANGQLTPLMLDYLAIHKAPAEARKSDGMQAVLRGYERIAAKDLRCVLELAGDAGCELPAGRLVSTLTEALYGIEP